MVHWQSLITLTLSAWVRFLCMTLFMSFPPAFMSTSVQHGVIPSIVLRSYASLLHFFIGSSGTQEPAETPTSFGHTRGPSRPSTRSPIYHMHSASSTPPILRSHSYTRSHPLVLFRHHNARGDVVYPLHNVWLHNIVSTTDIVQLLCDLVWFTGKV